MYQVFPVVKSSLIDCFLNRKLDREISPLQRKVLRGLLLHTIVDGVTFCKRHNPCLRGPFSTSFLSPFYFLILNLSHFFISFPSSWQFSLPSFSFLILSHFLSHSFFLSCSFSLPIGFVLLSHPLSFRSHLLYLFSTL